METEKEKRETELNNQINNFYMKRLSKGKGYGTSTEIKLNNFKCTYGTLDTRDCKGIYINSITYVQPDLDYKKDIDKFKHSFERYMNAYINHKFEGNIKHIIYSIDERSADLNNRLNTTQTLLPVELTILFTNKIIYKEIIDEINILLKFMIIYFESYKGLSIEAQRYKNFNKKD